MTNLDLLNAPASLAETARAVSDILEHYLPPGPARERANNLVQALHSDGSPRTVPAIIRRFVDRALGDEGCLWTDRSGTYRLYAHRHVRQHPGTIGLAAILIEDTWARLQVCPQARSSNVERLAWLVGRGWEAHHVRAGLETDFACTRFHGTVRMQGYHYLHDVDGIPIRCNSCTKKEVVW